MEYSWEVFFFIFSPAFPLIHVRAGPSLGEEPRTVFSLPQGARLRAGPQHEACAGKEGQERGFGDGMSLPCGLRASLGRALSAPFLPRSSK